MRTLTILTLLCASVLGTSLSARADDKFGPSSERNPSMLSYGFEGLGTGALVGLSVGYIACYRAFNACGGSLKHLQSRRRHWWTEDSEIDVVIRRDRCDNKSRNASGRGSQ